MSRTENLGFHGDEAGRVNKVIAWIIAFDAYDYCDGAPLAELLRSDEPIPPELRPILADIVSGARKPNRKAAEKLKISPAERMRVAASLSAVLGLIDALENEPVIDLDYSLEERVEAKAVDLAADAMGVEPIVKSQELYAHRDRVYDLAMEHFNVSRQTVGNWLRHLRKKIKNYPAI